ncbi:hypothetical protein BB559_007233 [Furculomyces boomerangus]|uniref:N-acyl-aliphatic-L-amino acid amidohydrolase n=2 Tax=Harpellales TaxID=61421 RepID=A0A2T9XY93_9FUNG|nr:hypothetical protein BB559_007233 [Furculomyces boomerangus]PWA01102.1 hypothetical protein BB558_002812 [Smittium angustum]
MEPESVKRFREYLRIKTVHPKPEYWECADFLVAQAKEIGVEHQIIEPVKGKPIVVLKLAGSDPSLKSILLNSHTDVVPVYEEKWNYPPFGAERVLMDNGEYHIYARGAQDMKVTGSCYLEALREIKASGKQLLRNVYAMFVPDEEIGGEDGMGAFVKTQEFKDMNGGFDIDEGRVSPNTVTSSPNRERTLCWVKFTARGNTGHGSQFIEATAIEKMLPVIYKLMEIRDESVAGLSKFGEAKALHQGHFTSVNLTQFEGGKQANVVPAEYIATFDIRITPDVDCHEFYTMLENLAKENDVELEYIKRGLINVSTDLPDTNPFLSTFNNVCKRQGVNRVPVIMAGITDARYIREAGIPAIGINPIINHRYLAHDHDEYIMESRYLSAIKFYVDMIESMANVSS